MRSNITLFYVCVFDCSGFETPYYCASEQQCARGLSAGGDDTIQSGSGTFGGIILLQKFCTLFSR